MYQKSKKQNRTDEGSVTSQPQSNNNNQGFAADKQTRTIRKHHDGYGNRPFEDVLRTVKRDNPQSAMTNPQSFIDLPAVNKLANDGIDHINIHHTARTNLGKALSAYGESVFMHNRWGRFLTVHGFMSWLCSPKQPDNFRTMSGTRVERAMFRQETVMVHNFYFVFFDATWQKIKANKELYDALAANTLPFDHYYYQTVSKDPLVIIRSRVQSSITVIRGMNELRDAARGKREPNLAFMLLPQDRAEYLHNLEKGCSTLELSFLGGASQQTLVPESFGTFVLNEGGKPQAPKKKKKPKNKDARWNADAAAVTTASANQKPDNDTTRTNSFNSFAGTSALTKTQAPAEDKHVELDLGIRTHNETPTPQETGIIVSNTEVVEQVVDGTDQVVDGGLTRGDLQDMATVGALHVDADVGLVAQLAKAVVDHADVQIDVSNDVVAETPVSVQVAPSSLERFKAGEAEFAALLVSDAMIDLPGTSTDVNQEDGGGESVDTNSESS